MGSASWNWFAKEWKSRSLWLWVHLDKFRSPLLLSAAFSPMSFTTALAPLIAALQVMASAKPNAKDWEGKRGINLEEWSPCMFESQLALSLTNLKLLFVCWAHPRNTHTASIHPISQRNFETLTKLSRIDRMIFFHHVCVPAWLGIPPSKNLSIYAKRIGITNSIWQLLRRLKLEGSIHHVAHEHSTPVGGHCVAALPHVPATFLTWNLIGVSNKKIVKENPTRYMFDIYFPGRMPIFLGCKLEQTIRRKS